MGLRNPDVKKRVQTGHAPEAPLHNIVNRTDYFEQELGKCSVYGRHKMYGVTIEFNNEIDNILLPTLGEAIAMAVAPTVLTRVIAGLGGEYIGQQIAQQFPATRNITIAVVEFDRFGHMPMMDVKLDDAWRTRDPEKMVSISDHPGHISWV